MNFPIKIVTFNIAKIKPLYYGGYISMHIEHIHIVLCVVYAVHAKVSPAKHDKTHKIIHTRRVCRKRKIKTKFNSSADVIETDLNSISMHMNPENL